ncbi:hypothetical protein GDO86_013545 [Hymenochirus boettgeri]|uniref:Uncharacterized protein n=1 Tax=Hymenochirus boettgeri TaxID=247094 RepID=A0A8T2IVC1_9PIPI|nr:hypothetical protein GDO86_013545 [Hymenochirus boettgeri]
MRAQTLLPLLWILVLGHYTSGYEIVFPQLVVNRERRNIYHQQEQGSDNLLYSIETIKQTLLLKLQRNR